MFQENGKLEGLVEVVVACFFGGTVGTLVALWINGNFWWLGVMLGGFLGYVAYDFSRVIAAARVAFGAVTTVTTWPRRTRRGMSRLWEAVQERPEGVLIGALCGTTILAVVTVFVAVVTGVGIVETWLVSIFALPFYAGFGARTGYKMDPRWRGVWEATVGFIRQLPTMFLAVLKIPLIILRLIHSDMRMAVGCDAAIGVWFGYVVAVPIVDGLVGAIAGGIVGAILGATSHFIAKRFQLLTRENA